MDVARAQQLVEEHRQFANEFYEDGIEKYDLGDAGGGGIKGVILTRLAEARDCMLREAEMWRELVEQHRRSISDL